ncbi:MAG: cytochrome P450 [Myxococcota bacterium]|nr:cytochrome P450 [Myxococcota bacterium]
MADSLDVDFGRDPLPDLHAVLAELRGRHRIARVRYDGGDAWLILRHVDLAAALRNDPTFPAEAAYRRFAEPAQGRTMQCMAPQEHRRQRALVAPWFSPSAIAELVPTLLEPLARELIERFASSGEADLVRDLTRPFPFAVIRSLLGLPEGDEAVLQGWAHGLLSHRIDPEGARAARAGFTRYLAPVLAQRRRAPEDDWLSRLASAEVDGTPLADEEIFSFVRLLFPAGADTTYLALGNLLMNVIAHPALHDSLRHDAGARQRAVEEGLRFEPAVALQPRVASSRGARIAELEIPPDAWVLFGLASANRDPAVFDDPELFDIDRTERASLAFGAGTHHCLGSHLARAEMEVVLRAVFERLANLRLAAGAEPTARGAIFRGPRSLRIRFEAR